ncbi:MAG TPA: glucose-1-phosphate cytidylyltransferase [Opitutus sp.]|nr:glucose-1-phosphate cytidylyltransferase [Opitutus sp.]
MKAVILAGGLGTRISEESGVRPKPLIEIGGRPILWHILKIYSAYGINDFIICCGYKGHMIKDFFASYAQHSADVTFDFRNGSTKVHRSAVEPWCVTCVDTGSETMTGGRLRRIRHLLGDETFCVTYGDGVSDVDIGASIAFHRRHGRLGTVTAVQPAGRFGAFTLPLDGDAIETFQEKPRGDGAWINGGFFVLEPAALDHVKDDTTVWEREPLETLAQLGQLRAWRHSGFWQPMDTLRDKTLLEEALASGNAPWTIWEKRSKVLRIA